MQPEQGPKYLKPQAAMRLLKMSRPSFRRLVEREDSPIRRRWYQSHWQYLAEDLRAYLAKHPPGGKHDRKEEEATVIAFMRAGKLDGEIAEQCGMLLREVERIRVSIGQQPTAHAYASATSEPAELAAPSTPRAPPRAKKSRAAEREDREEKRTPASSGARGALERARAKLEELRKRTRKLAFGKET